ncbi:hypothetical protein CTEN210_02161 [Chaetoceros tenuissimus]|uniref:Peptidase M41 domain-containing protein n=1 Tax=Chaetoceros tenuissimus TaxID=426638 RepID=A0AAD3CGI0_9STRA|nr:hypothetical protein CTEN210_02161 [Chaetoceros tenuissimus]
MRFSALIQWALISHSTAFTTLPSSQTSFRIRSTFSTLYSQVEESQFDECLSKADLKGAAKILQSSDINVTKDRFLEIFNAIEERTKEAEENNINKRVAEEGSINLGAMEYPPTSPARTEMTEMYKLLKSTGQLTAYGAAADGKYPALGTKNVTPILLEKITGLSMTSLTPKPTNTLLLAGVALAVLEGIVSVGIGLDLNFTIFATLFLAFLDKLLVNGAVFETATRIFMPEYTDKIRKHEAGHFLCAYLLGCPVEGCVLSTWAALNDTRFGGKRTTVNAGTSFFDPNLSDEINGRKPLTRSSIDRYSIIVMGGIAAEALNFGIADGGAGDEMALVSFLSNLNPRSGGAMTWNIDSIKNQARWGALQAVLLLREYKACYDALVDALERGGELGECVYAIETAIKENGLPSVAEKPLGYIVDQGLYGEWMTDLPATTSTTTETKPTTSIEETKELSVSSIEEEVLSLEELKKRMEDKLREIDSKLDKLE